MASERNARVLARRKYLGERKTTLAEKSKALKTKNIWAVLTQGEYKNPAVANWRLAAYRVFIATTTPDENPYNKTAIHLAKQYEKLSFWEGFFFGYPPTKGFILKTLFLMHTLVFLVPKIIEYLLYWAQLNADPEKYSYKFLKFLKFCISLVASPLTNSLRLRKAGRPYMAMLMALLPMLVIATIIMASGFAPMLLGVIGAKYLFDLISIGVLSYLVPFVVIALFTLAGMISTSFFPAEATHASIARKDSGSYYTFLKAANAPELRPRESKTGHQATSIHVDLNRSEDHLYINDQKLGDLMEAERGKILPEKCNRLLMLGKKPDPFETAHDNAICLVKEGKDTFVAYWQENGCWGPHDITENNIDFFYQYWKEGGTIFEKEDKKVNPFFSEITLKCGYFAKKFENLTQVEAFLKKYVVNKLPENKQDTAVDYLIRSFHQAGTMEFLARAVERQIAPKAAAYMNATKKGQGQTREEQGIWYKAEGDRTIRVTTGTTGLIIASTIEQPMASDPFNRKEEYPNIMPDGKKGYILKATGEMSVDLTTPGIRDEDRAQLVGFDVDYGSQKYHQYVRGIFDYQPKPEEKREHVPRKRRPLPEPEQPLPPS